MAAAYAAIVPLLEVPSGILADRWSRSGILIISSVAAAASALLGGLSRNVPTYIAAALILGVYFAMNSGTLDSVVYDTVIEETSSPDLYERWIGRVRIVESAAFATSALTGGLLAGWTSPRLTYFLTVPFVLASIIAFSRFREPRLHRAAEPLALRRHVATTVHAMTRIPSVRRLLLLAALTALLSQAILEFGPLWLVTLRAPAAAFGPYWALLVATFGAGGHLAARSHLGRRRAAVGVAVVLALTPILLATSHSVVVVAAAQTALQLTSPSSGFTPDACYTTPYLPTSAQACHRVPAPSHGCCSCRSRSASAPWPAPRACTQPGGSSWAPARPSPRCWSLPPAPPGTPPPKSKPSPPPPANYLEQIRQTIALLERIDTN